MKSENVVQTKSYDFALRIIKVYKYLIQEPKKRICFIKTIVKKWNFRWC
jgi:hypothetical protein